MTLTVVNPATEEWIAELPLPMLRLEGCSEVKNVYVSTED